MRQQVVVVGVVDRETPFRAGARAELERAGDQVVDSASLEALIAGARLDLLLQEERGLREALSGLPPIAVTERGPTTEGFVRSFAAGAIVYINRRGSGDRLRVMAEDAWPGSGSCKRRWRGLILDDWRLKHRIASMGRRGGIGR